MQDPTEQGSQKNTFVAWNGRDWITMTTPLILPHKTFSLVLLSCRYYRDVISEHTHQIGVETERNFLQSMGIDFHQDGFLKLISRYDKCIGVGGEYMEK
ncbi:hypothetical protein AVEN_21239-1 [Araneus ventricosus]|uniref:Uncharacterized protein n=1 Tax=Araneus ventricosus TaxID=182803 RepID=A0A4Y2GJ52_ARAVE|nr:hypothetical protein AVEN_21239-1 [Araneus ventricosus]